MATIEEYRTGKAARAVRKAFDVMEALDTPLSESPVAEIFRGHIEHLSPMVIDAEQAAELIGKAGRCAAGERICRCQFPDTPASSAVFLDELADAMVAEGHARFVSAKEAADILSRDRGRPLVASRVSGAYREICRSWPRTCFYWNMEKHGLKCLQRRRRKG